MPRGLADPTPTRTYRPEVPTGRFPPQNFRFGEETTASSGLILPGVSSFRGGDAITDTDGSPKSLTTYTMSPQHYDSGISSGLDRRSLDSGGLNSTTGLERRIQSMAITESRINPQGPRVRLPTRGQTRTTKIAEMGTTSSTVQAPTRRSNSPQLTYVSNNPPQPNYSLGQFRTPMSTMHSHVQPTYYAHPHMHSQSPSHIDVRTMLQQNLQFFVQDKEGDT